MFKDWLVRLVGATAITLTIAAVCQELEKPKPERGWHGKIGLVPYDFRLPTLERARNSYWNPDDEHVFTPPAWGVGWSVNVYALMEKLSILRESYLSEDDFLMPTPTLKQVLEDRPIVEEA